MALKTSTSSGPRSSRRCASDRARLGPRRAGRLHRRGRSTDMPPPVRDDAIASIDALDPASGSASRSARRSSHSSARWRSRRTTPTSSRRDRRRRGRLGGDRLRPAGRAAAPQGLVVAGGFVKDRFEVVVVGSGAGGGVVAGELGAARPRRPPPRGGPAPDGGRLRPLGGEGEPHVLVAAPLRPPCPTATWSRSSPGAASAGRRRSTRRWRCGRTSRTSPSGTARAA